MIFGSTLLSKPLFFVTCFSHSLPVMMCHTLAYLQFQYHKQKQQNIDKYTYIIENRSLHVLIHTFFTKL